jgi:hypothetical protein
LLLDNVTYDPTEKYHTCPVRGISGTAAKSSLVHSPSGRSVTGRTQPAAVGNPPSGIKSNLANPPDHHGVLFQLFSQQNHELRETTKPSSAGQTAKFAFFV